MRLEDFIKENQEAFNNEEPMEGHFERFEKRLNESKEKKENKPRRRISNLRWLAGVAAVMAGLVIGLTLFMNNEQTGSHMCIVSGEMLETQNYYMSVLNSEAVQVEKLLDNVDPETRSEVMSDVKKIIDDSENFATTFCNSSDDGVAIMVEYYQTNIQTLQNMASVFEDVSANQNI